MPLIAAAGFSMTRDNWAWNEDTSGAYPEYPDKFKNYIELSNDLQVDMLSLLGLSNSNYNDTADGNCTTEQKLQAIENFGEYFARTYGDYTEYAEIGNEYNLGDGTDEDLAADYVEILKSYYTGIKRGNPNMKVVAFATATVDIEFIRTALAMGAGNYLDAISVHLYHITNIPEKKDRWRAVTWPEYVMRLHSLCEEFELNDIELWGTEAGWYTGNVSEYPTGSYPKTERQQAEYYVRMMALNEAYDLLDKLIFYDFQDDGVDTTYDQHNWGIIHTWTGVDTPYGAKPAYTAVASYNNLLADAESTNLEISGSDDNQIYNLTFEKENGKTMYMIWSLAADCEKSVDIDAAYAVVYDIFGNRSLVPTEHGECVLNIGTSPIYVEALETDFVELYRNGEKIEFASQLKAGDTLNLHVVCADFTEGRTVYYVAYSNGVLVDFCENALQSGEESIEISCEATEVDMIKVFLWDDLNTMQPYAEYVWGK